MIQKKMPKGNKKYSKKAGAVPAEEKKRSSFENMYHSESPLHPLREALEAARVL